MPVVDTTSEEIIVQTDIYIGVVIISFIVCIYFCARISLKVQAHCPGQ